MPEQKWTWQNQIRLVEYSYLCRGIRYPSEVPRFAGKLIVSVI